MGTHIIFAKKADQVDTVGPVGRLRKIMSVFGSRNVSSLLNVNAENDFLGVGIDRPGVRHLAISNIPLILVR